MMILISRQTKIQVERLTMRKSGIYIINSTIRQEDIIVMSIRKSKIVTKKNLLYIQGLTGNSKIEVKNI